MEENIAEKIEKLLLEENKKAIAEELENLSTVDIVEILSSLEKDKMTAFFKMLKNADEVFSELRTEEQEYILSSLDDKEVSKLLSVMPPDDITSLFENLDEDTAKRLFSLLEEEDQKTAKHLLAYPEESVGRLMTTEFISVRDNYTVKQTLDAIKRKGKDSEVFSVVYVTDRKGELVGSASFRTLFFSAGSKKISSVMREAVYIVAFADQEEAVSDMKKYNLIAMPVVDLQKKLLGIVTIDDIMDIASEEQTEDFHKLGGIISTNGYEMESLKTSPIHFLYKRRIVWLVSLVFINIFSGAIMGAYQNIISKYIALVLFMPLLIDSSGNAGSQSSTLVIRALATGTLQMSDFFKMFLKEALVALLLGLTMGACVSVIGMIRGGFYIAIVVTLAMIATVVFGSLIGLCLPFIFTKMKMDPAASSAPLITSLCDISGVAIYFTIATFILTYT